MLQDNHRHLYNTLFLCNSPHYCKIKANLSAIHFKSLLSRAELRLQVWMTVKAAAAAAEAAATTTTTTTTTTTITNHFNANTTRSQAIL